MSVNISVSNTKQDYCKQIASKLLKSKINCRLLNTFSVVDDNIETGCFITLGREYNTKKKLSDVWNIIKSEYDCSHLKIDGIFDGCIYDYLNADFCPGNNVQKYKGWQSLNP